MIPAMAASCENRPGLYNIIRPCQLETNFAKPQLLSSPFGWNGTIVPCGKFLVKGDFRCSLVAFWGFLADGVIAGEYPDRGGQTGFRAGPRHGLAHDLKRREQESLTSACHVWKEAVLDRVVLRTVWRIVGDADFSADAIRQLLQVVFENVPVGGVAAAAIAEHQDAGGARISGLAEAVPPVGHAVAGEPTGVVA